MAQPQKINRETAEEREARFERMRKERADAVKTQHLTPEQKANYNGEGKPITQAQINALP